MTVACVVDKDRIFAEFAVYNTYCTIYHSDHLKPIKNLMYQRKWDEILNFGISDVSACHINIPCVIS